MVKKVEKDNEALYQCEECGMHYESEETAQKCQAWCGENHSCNIEIIKEAVENKKGE